jgi:hypothetical protein
LCFYSTAIFLKIKTCLKKTELVSLASQEELVELMEGPRLVVDSKALVDGRTVDAWQGVEACQAMDRQRLCLLKPLKLP